MNLKVKVQMSDNYALLMFICILLHVQRFNWLSLLLSLLFAYNMERAMYMYMINMRPCCMF